MCGDGGRKRDRIMKNDFYNKLCGILCDGAVFLEEPMKLHTSFQIGGPCEYFVKISTKKELSEVFTLCKQEEIPFLMIGKGSNLLVKDEGMRGVVGIFTGELAETKREGNILIAGAGISLADLANCSVREELAGLEFSSGIPGTVGGAVFMNAGAYGGEMKDVLLDVEVFLDGEYKIFTKEELKLSYRKSLIQELPGAVVVRARFELLPDKKEEIQARIDELNERRREKQPLELPSAGSTFKRPENGFASKLIDEAGLRGTRIGGAEVSQKHTGFIVNVDDASCEDVKALISYIQKVVYEKSGIRLMPEVRML